MDTCFIIRATLCANPFPNPLSRLSRAMPKKHARSVALASISITSLDVLTCVVWPSVQVVD